MTAYPREDMDKQMLTQPKALHRAQNIVKGTREESECEVIGDKVFSQCAGTNKSLASLMLEAVNSRHYHQGEGTSH